MERRQTAKNILIVEDHALFAEMLAVVLGRALRSPSEPQKPGDFLSFAYAASVAEAMKRLSADRPFDLAVVDLILPDGDGTTVVREIKRRSPGTPVAVLTASEHQSEAMAAGADEVIPKSAKLAEIVASLLRLLGIPAPPDHQAD